MATHQSFKLTGESRALAFSADGKLIIIGGYDGGFKVFDTDKKKVIYKTKLKGPKSDIDIRHIGISFDNKYAAFSALWKVFVMSLETGEIVWEFEYSEAERMSSSPFCFFNRSSKLVIPNGDKLLIFDMGTRQSQYIDLPEGAGWTDCLAISPDDTLVAYKSNNDEHSIFITYHVHRVALDDRVFIYDTKNGALHKTLPIPSPPVKGFQVTHSQYMKFISDTTLLIQRKAYGLSCFDVDIGTELFTHQWKDIVNFDFLGCTLRNPQISDNGKYILFNKETPLPERLPNEKVIPIPEGLEYVLFDLAEYRILYRHPQKIGESPAAFHFATQRLAYTKSEWDENDRRTEHLYIYQI